MWFQLKDLIRRVKFLPGYVQEVAELPEPFNRCADLPRPEMGQRQLGHVIACGPVLVDGYAVLRAQDALGKVLADMALVGRATHAFDEIGVCGEPQQPQSAGEVETHVKILLGERLPLPVDAARLRVRSARCAGIPLFGTVSTVIAAAIDSLLAARRTEVNGELRVDGAALQCRLEAAQAVSFGSDRKEEMGASRHFAHLCLLRPPHARTDECSRFVPNDEWGSSIDKFQDGR